MSEEKKEDSCGSSKGCKCCCGMKLLIGLVIGALIFAAGMWFAKSHCSYMGKNYCPISGPEAK